MKPVLGIAFLALATVCACSSGGGGSSNCGDGGEGGASNSSSAVTSTSSGAASTGASGSGGNGGGDGGPNQYCGPICTGGQSGDIPISKEYFQSNSFISTAGNGSMRLKVVGDNNVITTEGGGSCVFDVYGNNNTIMFEAGGSIVANILSGTDNIADFTNAGGCNSVYFEHGSLTSIIQSCGMQGNNINGAPAENKVYTLP
jgi:hypothetical protein